MSDPDVEREDRANEERAKSGGSGLDTGILGTVERAFRGITQGQDGESDDPEDIQRRREATDREERA